MLKVTVVFKNGGVVEFDAADLVYSTSTEAATYGQLVGYEIKLAGTYTSLVFLDIQSIAGIVAVSDELVKENEQGG